MMTIDGNNARSRTIQDDLFFSENKFKHVSTIDAGISQFSIALSKDGNTLITGGLSDRYIRVWNIQTQRLIKSWLTGELTYQGDVDRINSIVLTPDEKLLVTGGHITQIWDFKSTKEVIKLTRESWSLHCLISLDSNILVTHNVGGLIVWDWKKRKRIRRNLSGNLAMRLAITSDSQFLIGEIDVDDNVCVRELKTGKSVLSLDSIGTGVSRIDYICVSPDDRLIAGTGTDGLIIWNMNSGEKLQVINKSSQMRLHRHLDMVGDVQFSSDSTALFTSGSDGQIQIWSVLTGQRIASVTPHYGLVNFCLDNECETLVTHGLLESRIEIWKVNKE